jgi:hypothetical protein
MKIDRKLWVIIGVVLGGFATFLFVDPIGQDPGYHEFADKRKIFGIPNFWNVITNLPFLVVGALGIGQGALGRAPGHLPELKPVYIAFFVGIFLTGCGSAYYHSNPTNWTLVWDRLPMTLSFMAFLCVVWGEHISPKMSLKMVWPLAAVGLSSVIYWYVTQIHGYGDLRPYGMVQFLPMLLLPLILLLYPSRLAGVYFIWGVLLATGISKLFEALDGPVYTALNMISGHSLKHLAAAGAPILFYIAGRRRTKATPEAMA